MVGDTGAPYVSLAGLRAWLRPQNFRTCYSAVTVARGRTLPAPFGPRNYQPLLTKYDALLANADLPRFPVGGRLPRVVSGPSGALRTAIV
jgi:hypothetical protein